MRVQKALLWETVHRGGDQAFTGRIIEVVCGP